LSWGALVPSPLGVVHRTFRIEVESSNSQLAVHGKRQV
jgi:hypothetical protein